MTLVDLIPTVRSLSRSDKLRLIQWIAGDLAGTDVSKANPTDQEAPFSIDAGRAIPIWLPDESYEAASIMGKALEEGKSAS